MLKKILLGVIALVLVALRKGSMSAFFVLS